MILVQKAEVKDQSVHQEVYRVEEVEEIFQGDASFAVVEVDRDEGKAGGGFPEEAHAGDQSAEKFLIVEQVEQQDQDDSFVVVVGLEEPGGQTACGGDQDLDDPLKVRVYFFVAYSIDGPDGQETQE